MPTRPVAKAAPKIDALAWAPALALAGVAVWLGFWFGRSRDDAGEDDA